MSRIGKKPIPLPKGVTVAVKDGASTVTRPPLPAASRPRSSAFPGFRQAANTRQPAAAYWR